MSDEQKQFLRLAVIDQKKYSEISSELNIDQKTLSGWWDGLNKEREMLSNLRRVWSKKCVETNFWDFKQWHETAERRCRYCEISEKEIAELISAGLIETKRLRTRGRTLEIERILPNEAYDKLTNLTFCCYWCNNAKTDEFTEEEFRPVGRQIGQIWRDRLNSRFRDRFGGGQGFSIQKP